MTSKLRKQNRHIKEKINGTQPFQGIQMDPGFMFTHSKEKKRIAILESPDGNNAYFNFYCMFTEVICGTTTNSKQPPILYMHLLLSRVRPTSEGCFIRMDQGGETSRHPHVRSLLPTHRYDVEQTGTASSSQIGGVERSHGSQGVAIRTMHHGANVPYRF